MVGKLKWVILCIFLIAGLVMGNLGCNKAGSTTTGSTTTGPTTTVPTTTGPTTTGPTTTVFSTTGKVDASEVVATSMYAGDWEGSFTYSDRKLDAEGLWQIGVWNPPKDFKVSLTFAPFPSNEKVAMPGGVSRIVALKITKVWVSEPFFETGPTGAAPKQGIIWLPTDPPTSTSNPSREGMGFQISFPNGSFLSTNFIEGALDVTADGETLSGDKSLYKYMGADGKIQIRSMDDGSYKNQEIAWEALPPGPDSQGKYPSSNVYYWRHLSWTITNVSKPSIKGSVFCIPVGDIGKPLTTDVTDNPENAKVTISGPVSRMLEVDKEGAYLFSNLPKGSYNVTASARWYTSQTKTVEVSQGQVIVDKFILFRGYGTVKGRVLYKGQGLNEATVRVVNVTTAVIAAADYTRKDGSYTFKVPAGQYLVFVGGGITTDPALDTLFKAYEKATHSITIEPDTVVTHDIVLSP